MKTIAMSLRPVVVSLMGLGYLASGHVWAGEDDSPLSLTFSENISHDSNFSKDDSKKTAETVSTTSVQGALNKSYGRQTYQLNGTLSALRYKNNDQLNNEARNLNGSFSSGLLRDWIVSLNGLYDQNLNAIQNNNAANRVVRNIRKYRDGGLSVQYGGNGGLFALVGTYDHNKQDYSLDTQQYQNSTQTSKGLKAIYYSSDVLNYSLGARRVVTDYPSNPNYTQTVDRNIDLGVALQLTGLSNFNATLTKRSTDYTPADLQSTKGWTGSLYWNYTPHGILVYNLGFSRTTGSDRVQSKDSQFVLPGSSQYGYGNDIVTTKINSDTVTSSLNAGMRAQLTGKISAGTAYAVTQYKVGRDYAVDYKHALDLSGSGSRSVVSYNHVLSFSVDYAVMRSLSLGCGYQRYSQGADGLYHLKYSGNTVNCSASFTLNP